ncbi:hypothetical protein THOM_1967 [Trachipleistophora hominis]|uniref:Uncharacterized protein n=1 Tax=Trachipleistophora hominis TaxID=72359 RepID=L7JUD8_TRAHO|nr:hypothetical protein THOM_1967 [Trachipleistophora hominis]
MLAMNKNNNANINVQAVVFNSVVTEAERHAGSQSQATMLAGVDNVAVEVAVIDTVSENIQIGVEKVDMINTNIQNAVFYLNSVSDAEQTNVLPTLTNEVMPNSEPVFATHVVTVEQQSFADVSAPVSDHCQGDVNERL